MFRLLMFGYRLSPYFRLVLKQALDPIPFNAGMGGGIDEVRSDGGINEATTDEDEGGAPSSDDATDDAGDNSSTTGAGGAGVLDGTSGASSAPYGTFSVDVVVYVRVEPSTIRFTCVPTSRVECILKFPTLDLAFSYRGENDGVGQMRQIGPEAAAVAAGRTSSLPPLNEAGEEQSAVKLNTTRPTSLPIISSSSSSKTEAAANTTQSSVPASPQAGEATSAASGLAFQFSGSLSNFSLLIFHPFGGPTTRTTANNYGFDDGFSASPHQQQQQPSSGKKEYMSLNVESIQVSISRSRTLVGGNQGGYRVVENIELGGTLG